MAGKSIVNGLMGITVRSAAAIALTALMALFIPVSARAISLEQACSRFASKLNAAQTAGDTQKAQTIYQEGSQRIASRFNGATCPNVKPPTP